ncbi:MAG TPA: alpha/beta fold hydrolase [Gemmatimonadaceae bacterium]|nr:alpha/beta fold hydrolase [Gemmatimonadaceae bacterium]
MAALPAPSSSVKRQVLFVQGGGEHVHDDWDGKLVESLSAALGPDYELRYPRMPDEDDPSYATWKAALEKEFAALNADAILVGHSIGGTILINALAECRPERRFGAIILIAAPFVGEGGWRSQDWQPQRELGSKLPVGVPVYLFHGLADDTAPPSHVDLYSQAIPQAHTCLLPGRDHQLNNDLTDIATAIISLPGETTARPPSAR